MTRRAFIFGCIAALAVFFVVVTTYGQGAIWTASLMGLALGAFAATVYAIAHRRKGE